MEQSWLNAKQNEIMIWIKVQYYYVSNLWSVDGYIL